jgi:hypothetical protein
MKELDKLDEKTVNAIKWAAAEFKYANYLKNLLEKIEREGPRDAHNDLGKAFQALAYLGKAEHKVESNEAAVLKLMKEIGKYLPAELKRADDALVRELDIARGELVELASRFTGKLSGELKKIRNEETLLKHYEAKKKDEKYIDKIKRELVNLVEHAKDEVSELVKWIGTTEAVLKKIDVGFVEKLKRLANE